MPDIKMASTAEDIMKRLISLGVGIGTESAKVGLILTERIIKKYKSLEDYKICKIDRSELKEFSMAFDDVKMKYSVEELEDKNKIAIVFHNDEIQKYKQAMKIIENSRLKINELKLSDFMKKYRKDDINRTGSLEVHELDRFRDYANRDTNLEYAIHSEEKEDSTIDYYIVYKVGEENKIENALIKSFSDFVGLRGKEEQRLVEMQLSAFNLAEKEINKENTEFIIVDYMFPKNYIIVLEDTWLKYNDNKIVEKSDVYKSKQQHKTDILNEIQSIKMPLVMSVVEFNDEQVKNNLISKSGYIHDIERSAKQENTEKEVNKRLMKLKNRTLSVEEKDNIKTMEKENKKNRKYVKQKSHSMIR